MIACSDPDSGLGMRSNDQSGHGGRDPSNSLLRTLFTLNDPRSRGGRAQEQMCRGCELRHREVDIARAIQVGVAEVSRPRIRRTWIPLG